jgi:hypothetical protein
MPCLACKTGWYAVANRRDGVGMPVCRSCALCGKQRCERCDAPGTPACTCPSQEELHQRAVNALRLEPEAPALARAEASMIADRGMQDQERMFHEHEDIAKLMHISSLDDRPYRTEAQPHRVERERQKVRDAGHDPDWRPEGDATTLFKPGKEYGLRECSDWAVESARATVRMVLGMEPQPPPELRQEAAEFLREEAKANGPWYIGGAFYKTPIPLREYYLLKIYNENSVSSTYFGERKAAGDPDQDICNQIDTYGLDLMLNIEDSLLTWHLKSFYADAGILEAGVKAVENEMDMGYFRELEPSGHCHVSTYPVRQSPRFAVDEGWKDGSQTVRKIRSVVHYSHPAPISGVHKYPEGNPNSSIDLGDKHAELTMGSGKRHFRNVGILRTSRAQVIQAKRDGQNAFRQVQTAPCDCWATGLFWPRDLKRTVEAIMAAETDEEADAMIDAVLPMHAVDDAVIMGMTSAMFSFQRAMEVPNRHANGLMRAFDGIHPPTDPNVVDFMHDRTARLGKAQGGKLDADDQYCDDGIRALINDLIKLLVDVKGPRRSWKVGDEAKRGEVKMAIFDTIFELELLMTMSPKKDVTTDGWMEALGIEGSPTEEIQRYPLRKRPGLKAEIGIMLNGPSPMVDKEALMTLLHKELWMLQMAPEHSLRLASGWAMMNAQTAAPSGKVAMSTAFKEDQMALADALIKEGSLALPLVPASYFPAFGSFVHIVGLQDASSTTGGGGWLLVEGKMHGISVRWPLWLIEAMRQMRYSISPAELWTELALLVILLRVQRRCVHSFVTDFTDNESARAAANRGRSATASMHPIAQAIARIANRDDITLRTLRVSTKENATADAMSREGGIQAGKDLAARLGVEFVEHIIEQDDDLWRLIHPILECPSSPSA